ncbi:MAG: RNA polymerase sigma factor [Clostridia bacterium]|nr:RNA polymerase sigma factor [Clostridia bacterium]
MLMTCLAMIDRETDRQTFEHIYKHYAPDISRRIRRFLKSKEDAEDAMQNTWLVITKNIEFYQGLSETSIKAYILRIAKNQAISIYRQRKREEERICDTDIATLSDNAELIRTLDESDISVIVSCIAALDEKYSDVLSLHYLHHHSAKEIAALLNMNEHTIRNRIARGREKLIKLLIGRGLHG